MNASLKRCIITIMNAFLQLPPPRLRILTVRRVQSWIARVLSALIVLGASFAWAANYHVAMTGDDTHPGTEAQPWRTLGKANSAAQSGDVINIGPGTWPERPTIPRAGTASSPITWRGTGDTTIVGGFNIRHDHIHIRNFRVDYLNSGAAGVIAIGEGNDNKTTGLSGNYVIVDNVTFTRQGSTALNVAGNFPHYTGPIGSICRNSRFYDCSTGSAVGISASQFVLENSTFTSNKGGDAIMLFGRNNTVRGCQFLNWSRPAGSTQHTDLFQSFSTNGQISEGHIIEGNFAYNCNETQLGNVDHVGEHARIKDWTFRNNIFVRVSNPFNLFAPGFKFHNNSFFRSPYGAGSCVILFAAAKGVASNTSIINNLFYKGGYDEASNTQGFYAFNISSGYSLAGLSIDNNLVIGSGAGTIKDATWTWYNANKNGFNGIDPRFVNAVNPTKPEDLRLLANSPAIGKGRNLSELFTTDFSGRLRGTKWDIGAFQSGKVLGAPGGFRTEESTVFNWVDGLWGRLAAAD